MALDLSKVKERGGSAASASRTGSASGQAASSAIDPRLEKEREPGSLVLMTRINAAIA